MYEIWKIEKKFWTAGLTAMHRHVSPEALIIPPTPMPPLYFKDLLNKAVRARPFAAIELTEKNFISADKTAIITYLACAKHPRYKSPYYARCSTTYVNQLGVYKIIAHTHRKLSKADL